MAAHRITYTEQSQVSNFFCCFHDFVFLVFRICAFVGNMGGGAKGCKLSHYFGLGTSVSTCPAWRGTLEGSWARQMGAETKPKRGLGLLGTLTPWPQQRPIAHTGHTVHPITPPQRRLRVPGLASSRRLLRPLFPLPCLQLLESQSHSRGANSA